MLDRQRHRGPDADGLLADQRVVLGHIRLAIIDLSVLGRQPMSDGEELVSVVFNGEIYNYKELTQDLRAAGRKFRSNSDTEVLIHGYKHWGLEGLLERLNGMFAFALYDRRDGAVNPLYLVRDRLGIKPLYYRERDGCLSFASEVHAFRQSGEPLANNDTSALVGFLSYGSVPAPRTWLRDVHCLPAGHYMALRPGSTQIKQYWDLSYPHTKQSPVDVRELLRDCVERQLIADVPLGVFLSGGLDSAGLVAMRAKHFPGPCRP